MQSADYTGLQLPAQQQAILEKLKKFNCIHKEGLKFLPIEALHVELNEPPLKMRTIMLELRF